MFDPDATDPWTIRASDGTVGSLPTAEVVAVRAAEYALWGPMIQRAHKHAVLNVRNERLSWTPLRKPLAECTVALVTSGGVHLRTQAPFDVYDEKGDWSSREIPGDAATADLTVTHTHYATDDALQDPNVMLPLDRLRELAAEGAIGRVSSLHFGFMGWIPDPGLLIAATAPAAARALRERGVDAVVLTPG